MKISALTLSVRTRRISFLFVLTLLFSATLYAQTPGTLDPSFGSGGKVQFAVGTEDRVNAMVLQPDGKIVLVGRTRPGAVRFDFAVARLNADGTIDTGFGTGGRVVTSLNVQGSPEDEASAVALQPNGKIVVVGSARTTGGGLTHSGIVRYNPNGTLDSTFGNGGIAIVEHAVNRAVALQSDGKIVVGGGGGSAQLANYQIARLLPNGALDPTWDGDGHLTLDFDGSGDGVWALLIQPDGKIVAAGQSRLLGEDDNFAIARFNPDSTLDTTFGVGGKVRTDFDGSTDIAYAATLQSDGKIVLAGQARTGTNEWQFGLARYNPDGSLDNLFGVQGRARTDFGVFDIAFSVKVQPNGKIVTAGVIGGTSTGFAVSRHNPDGTIDQGFGFAGKATTYFESIDEGHAVAIQPDGKIVVGGFANGGAIIGQFAAARFFGDAFTGSTGSVSGRVFGPNGQPVGAARLSLNDEMGLRLAARTNAFGYFQFNDVALGHAYTLTVITRDMTFTAVPVLVNGNVTLELRAEP
jgi:uncharacterized delta-60 repeat protein